MEKTCRTCLSERRSLRSIFNSDKSPSYAEMIMNITNSKKLHCNGYPDKICLSCRNKLQECYDFKTFVESNENKLNGVETGINGKRLCFNNFTDLKIEIDCVKMEPHIKCEDLIKTNIDDSNVFSYKDISIKRVDVKHKKDKVLSVEEFLDTIKDEVDDNNYPCDYGNDYDYDPHRQHKKKNKKDKKGKQGKLSNKMKPIKPIILREYKMVPAYKTVLIRKPSKRRVLKESVCPYCGKLAKNIRSHLLIHIGERKFTCSKCPKAFFSKCNLENHMAKHDGVKNFSCNDCVATFFTATELKSHAKSHSKLKEYICNICSKGFTRKDTMRKHVIRHSSANKNVKCELCNMSFFEKFCLQHHMRIHTGERPYNCELCSQPYSYKHDFNRHCLKKHGVFLKQRSVYVMNAEVLAQERRLLKELANSKNPYEGSQGPRAYQFAIKAIEKGQIPLLDITM